MNYPPNSAHNSFTIIRSLRRGAGSTRGLKTILSLPRLRISLPRLAEAARLVALVRLPEAAKLIALVWLAEPPGLIALVRLAANTLRESRDRGCNAKGTQIYTYKFPLVIASLLVPRADRRLMTGAGNPNDKSSSALAAAWSAKTGTLLGVGKAPSGVGIGGEASR